MTTRRANVVWEPDGKGWRKVRARVPRPRSGRSERVPRPPLPPVHAAGEEERPSVRGYSAREIAEGLREAVKGRDNARRLLVELEDLLEASAKIALVPVELVKQAPRAALIVAWWMFRGRRGKCRR